MRTTTRGESGTNRDASGPASAFTNGGGGSAAAQRASGLAGPSATDWAGSSMRPQTSRRGCPDRDARRVQGRAPADRRSPTRRLRVPSADRARSPALAARARALADAPDLGGRELADAWEAALDASGLPAFVPAGRARARVAFGAPLSAGLVAEAELADIVLTEFEPTWRVREALAAGCPTAGGWSTCTTSGSGRRRWPARSWRPTTGSRCPARRADLARALRPRSWPPTTSRANGRRGGDRQPTTSGRLSSTSRSSPRGRRRSSGRGPGSTPSSVRGRPAAGRGGPRRCRRGAARGRLGRPRTA